MWLFDPVPFEDTMSMLDRDAGMQGWPFNYQLKPVVAIAHA